MTTQSAEQTRMREVFHFLAYAWDINLAEDITAGREAITVNITEAAYWLGLVRINEAHAATVDLGKPLIIAPIQDLGHMPIDGFHRIWKARRDGVARLPAVLLTPEEEYQVRIHGGDKDRPQPPSV